LADRRFDHLRSMRSALVRCHCPAFFSARVAGERGECNAHLRIIACEFPLYASDHDDRLPEAAGWMDAILPYIMDTSMEGISCPAVSSDDGQQLGYAMNSSLSNKKVDSVKEPSATPLIFDSVLLRWNAASGLETCPYPDATTGPTPSPTPTDT